MDAHLVLPAGASFPTKRDVIPEALLPIWTGGGTETWSPTSRLRACISILETRVGNELGERFVSDIEDAPYDFLRLVCHVQTVMHALGPKNGYFSGMPTELLEHIFCFTGNDFVNLSATCTLFRHVCEQLARRLFLSTYGVSKPDGASWCRCLHVLDSASKKYNMPHTALYYGLSNIWFRGRVENMTAPWLYRSMVARGHREAITNLIIPYWINYLKKPHCRLSADFLVEVMRAHDQQSFDALMDAASPTHRFSSDFMSSSWMLLHLPPLLNNELLAQLFFRMATMPEKVNNLIHDIGRACKTKEHVELLNFVLATFGPRYKVTKSQKLSDFWSPSIATHDVLDAYVQVWLTYHPDLLAMRKFCTLAFIHTACNKALPGWMNCLHFLERHPDLRFNNLASHGIRMWWQTCLWPITEAKPPQLSGAQLPEKEVLPTGRQVVVSNTGDEQAAIQMFDFLLSRELPLDWHSNSLHGWTLQHCILRPLIQFHEQSCTKAGEARPVFDRGCRVWPKPLCVPTQFLQHVAEATLEREDDSGLETCPKTRAAYVQLWVYYGHQ